MLDFAAISSLFPGKPKPTKLGPCASLADLKKDLGAHIKRTAGKKASDDDSCELSFRSDASIPLIRPARGPYSTGGGKDLPSAFLKDWINVVDDEDSRELDFWEEKRGTLHPQATAGIITRTEDAEIRKRLQRAAARAIILAVERVDGYKYTIGNRWEGKGEDGLRFSYICQDSVQNKDRNAEGFMQSPAIPWVRGKRGAIKPTYDCKGRVAIKFNSSTRAIEIHYKHCQIHKPVVKCRSSLEVAGGEGLEEEQSATAEDDVVSHQGGGESQPALPAQTQKQHMAPSAAPQPTEQRGRPPKRKRDAEPDNVQTVSHEQSDQHPSSVLQADSSTTQPRPAKRRSESDSEPVSMPPMGVQYDIPDFMTLSFPQRSLPPATASIHRPHSAAITTSGRSQKVTPQRRQAQFQPNDLTRANQQTRTAQQSPLQKAAAICEYVVPFDDPPASRRSDLSKPSAETQSRSPSLRQLMSSEMPAESRVSSRRTPLALDPRPQDRLPPSSAHIEISRGQENQPPLGWRSLAKPGKDCSGNPRPGPPRPHPPRPPVQPPPESALVPSAANAPKQPLHGSTKQHGKSQARIRCRKRSVYDLHD